MRAELGAATVIGAVVGVAVAVLAGTAFDGGGTRVTIEFWGWLYGLAAAAVAGAASYALLVRGRARRTGLYALAVAFAVIGAALAWWIVMWGVAPWTLEGAVTWGPGVASLAAASYVLSRARRMPR